MMTRNLIVTLGSVCLAVLVVSPAWGQKNNRNKQDEKRENERVADAQKEVRKQQGELNEAEQKLRGLMRSSNALGAKLTSARNHWRETREDVADKLATSMGIEAALARLKEVKAELAAFTQPVLDELHKSNQWLTANAAAEAARDAIEQLHEDIDVADADRKSKLNELTKRVLRPSELDKQAVLDKPEGKRLTDRVTEALAAIEKIRRAIPDEKVDADPAVTQAKKAIEKAEQELAKHQQSIAAQRTSVQKAQQQLQQSRQKLQQAQAADARDKNRK